ncbi:MAG: hypothetical protein ACE5MG_01855 [Candidatus Methylomirabilales bacterium]
MDTPRSASGSAAIVVALPWEAAPLAKYLGLRGDGVHDGVTQYRGGGDRVLLLQAGMGLDGAVRALASLDKPAVLLSAGFCGGVGPEVGLGSIVVASRVIRNSTSFPADPMLLETATRTLKTLGLPFHVGTLRTVDEVLTLTGSVPGPEDPHILAVDMESAYLADAARHLGVPFLGIRAVSDTPAEPWAVEGRAFLDPDGRLKPMSVTASILRRPASGPRMLHLAFKLRLATRQLAQGIDALLKEHPNLFPP